MTKTNYKNLIMQAGRTPTPNPTPEQLKKRERNERYMQSLSPDKKRELRQQQNTLTKQWYKNRTETDPDFILENREKSLNRWNEQMETPGGRDKQNKRLREYETNVKDYAEKNDVTLDEARKLYRSKGWKSLDDQLGRLMIDEKDDIVAKNKMTMTKAQARAKYYNTIKKIAQADVGGKVFVPAFIEAVESGDIQRGRAMWNSLMSSENAIEMPDDEESYERFEAAQRAIGVEASINKRSLRRTAGPKPRGLYQGRETEGEEYIPNLGYGPWVLAYPEAVGQGFTFYHENDGPGLTSNEDEAKQYKTRDEALDMAKRLPDRGGITLTVLDYKKQAQKSWPEEAAEEDPDIEEYL